MAECTLGEYQLFVSVSFHYNQNLKLLPRRLLKASRWRKEPATDGQKAMLRKRHLAASAGPEKGTLKTFDVNTLTKGQAANMITRLKHGAQVRGWR